MNIVSSVTLAAFQSSGVLSHVFDDIFLSVHHVWSLPVAFQTFSLPVLQGSVFYSKDLRHGVSGEHICVRHVSAIPMRCLFRNTASLVRFSRLATVSSGYFSVSSSRRTSSSSVHLRPPIRNNPSMYLRLFLPDPLFSPVLSAPLRLSFPL